MSRARVVSNADNEWLEPLGPIGHVSEVNGPDAAEVPAFVATRHELLQVAKYWADVELDLWFHMTTWDCAGSDWLRRASFAGRRLGRIEEALGGDAVKQVVRQVREEFAARQDPRHWRAFADGDREELERIAEEINGTTEP